MVNVEMSVRLYNILSNANALDMTLSEFSERFGETELLRIRNFGNISMAEVKGILESARITMSHKASQPTTEPVNTPVQYLKR